MVPYILLILIPFLMYFLVLQKQDGRRQLCAGYGEHNELNNLALPAFFFFLLLLLCCKAETVGHDTSNYRNMFEKSENFLLADVFSEWEDCLFVLLNYVIYNFSDNFQIYLTIISVLIVTPLMYFYCQDKRHALLKIVLFVNMSTFVMMFSGIRQMIAVSLGVLAFDCIKKKRNLLFLILTAVAFLIHTSGFMIIFLYPLYHIRLRKKHLIFVVPLMIVLLVFNNAIFTLLNSFLMQFSSKFELETSNTGAFTSLILFALLAAFSYFISDEEQMEKEDFALRNILMAAVAMQCFAPLHVLAMRMNYYFIIFVPVAVAKAFATANKKYANVAKMGEIVIITFFVFYFVYTLYMELATGNSVLNTVPYVAFWEQ